jgi:hypothetical protein
LGKELEMLRQYILVLVFLSTLVLIATGATLLARAEGSGSESYDEYSGSGQASIDYLRHAPWGGITVEILADGLRWDFYGWRFESYSSATDVYLKRHPDGWFAVWEFHNSTWLDAGMFRDGAEAVRCAKHMTYLSPNVPDVRYPDGHPGASVSDSLWTPQTLSGSGGIGNGSAGQGKVSTSESAPSHSDPDSASHVREEVVAVQVSQAERTVTVTVTIEESVNGGSSSQSDVDPSSALDTDLDATLKADVGERSLAPAEGQPANLPTGFAQGEEIESESPLSRLEIKTKRGVYLRLRCDSLLLVDGFLSPGDDVSFDCAGSFVIDTLTDGHAVSILLNDKPVSLPEATDRVVADFTIPE